MEYRQQQNKNPDAVELPCPEGCCLQAWRVFFFMRGGGTLKLGHVLRRNERPWLHWTGEHLGQRWAQALLWGVQIKYTRGETWADPRPNSFRILLYRKKAHVRQRARKLFWLTKDSGLEFEAVVGDGGLLLLVGVGLLFGGAEGLAPQQLLEVVDLLVAQALGLEETTERSGRAEKRSCPGKSASPGTGGCAWGSAPGRPDSDPGCACWPWAASRPLVPGEGRGACRRVARATGGGPPNCSCWGTADTPPRPQTSPPLPERDRHRGPSVFHTHSGHVQNLDANHTTRLKPSALEQEVSRAECLPIRVSLMTLKTMNFPFWWPLYKDSRSTLGQSDRRNKTAHPVHGPPSSVLSAISEYRLGHTYYNYYYYV